MIVTMKYTESFLIFFHKKKYSKDEGRLKNPRLKVLSIHLIFTFNFVGKQLLQYRAPSPD